MSLRGRTIAKLSDPAAEGTPPAGVAPAPARISQERVLNWSGPQSGAQPEILSDDVTRFRVAPEMTVREVITRIDDGCEGLALMMDEGRRLLGTVTDGDVRRALLAGIELERPCADLLTCDIQRPNAQPITAPFGMTAVALLHLMGKHSIRHIPLMDKEQRVAGIALLSRLVRDQQLPLRAVIMAGGFGVRLRPLTEDMPKPLLPVGDRPLLERTVEQLGLAGIRKVNITTHYLAEKIRSHIGDGSSFGTAVEYCHESEALGTAGSLRCLEPAATSDPLLVINGDVLTNVNFRALFDYHREHEARITVGVRRYAMKVPYGVVEARGAIVESIKEKPEVCFFVNAGIYLIEADVCQIIPEERRFDMTDLIDRVIELGGRVVSFPIHEYWLDIGRLDDYEQAQQDVNAGKLNG